MTGFRDITIRSLTPPCCPGQGSALNLGAGAASCGAIAASGPARGDQSPLFRVYMRTILARALLLGAQKIRPYVDTTGPELKLFEGMKPKTTDTFQEHSAPSATDQNP